MQHFGASPKPVCSSIVWWKTPTAFSVRVLSRDNLRLLSWDEPRTMVRWSLSARVTFPCYTSKVTGQRQRIPRECHWECSATHVSLSIGLHWLTVTRCSYIPMD